MRNPYRDYTYYYFPLTQKQVNNLIVNSNLPVPRKFTCNRIEKTHGNNEVFGASGMQSTTDVILLTRSKEEFMQFGIVSQSPTPVEGEYDIINGLRSKDVMVSRGRNKQVKDWYITLT